MSQRIRESFDAYLDRVGLADVGPVQKRELRRAFYAGAWEVLNAGQETGGESAGEDEIVARLKAMVAECEEFGTRVLDGKD
jgi:hypothetical protein